VSAPIGTSSGINTETNKAHITRSEPKTNGGPGIIYSREQNLYFIE